VNQSFPQVAEALLLQDIAALTLARDLRDLRLAQRSDTYWYSNP
jgi:hypothetical protein